MRDRASHTAEVVCWVRAREQLRVPHDRVVVDPYAHYFLSAAGRLGLWLAGGMPRLADGAQALSHGLGTFVVARHRVLDDWLRADLASPELRQVVILGAGYDTRAWRLAPQLAGRVIYEVDHPATAGRKARKLAAATATAAAKDTEGEAWPQTQRRVVHCDFQTQPLLGVLQAAGFQLGARTAWIWEGVSMYLRRAAVDQTLRDIAAASAPGSSLGMDLWFLLDDPDLRASFIRASASVLSLLGEPVTFGLHPDDAADFLGHRGLRLEDSLTASQLQASVARGRAVYPALWCCRARVGPSLKT